MSDTTPISSNREIAPIQEAQKRLVAMETAAKSRSAWPEVVRDGKGFIDSSRMAVSWCKAKRDFERAFDYAVLQIRCMHVLGGLLNKAERSKGGYAPSAAATVAGASEYRDLCSGANLLESSSLRYQQVSRVAWGRIEAYRDDCKKKLTIPSANYVRRLGERDEKQAGAAGSVEIHPGDSMEVLPGLIDGGFDLLLTDPPYMSEFGDDFAGFVNDWVPLALPKIKPSGRAYIFSGSYPAEIKVYLDVIYGCLPPGWDFSDILVWTYRNTLGPSPTHSYTRNWQACFHLFGPDAAPLDSPSMKDQFAVHDVNAPDARTGIRDHAWQKPDQLAERLIRQSTVTGGKILDPFTGTGTFVAAASRLGRNSVGVERDPAMLAICRQRGLEISDAA